jgi:DnaJ-class molecular chaperone
MTRATRSSGPGTGPVMRPGDEVAAGTPQSGEGLCPACSGRGSIDRRACEACGGSGAVTVTVGDA